MKLYQKILFYYCVVISLLITVSGVLSSQTTTQLLMQLIFLPVTIYFCYTFLVQFLEKSTTKKEMKASRFSLVITAIFFLLLFTLSMVKLIKSPQLVKKIPDKIIPTQSLKPTPILYIQLKKEFSQDKINVREKPTKDAKIIGQMENKLYRLIASQSGWIEIEFNQTKGFVSDQFVEIKP
jgi:uncharacterized protein YgiM (DUF1202 family)